MPARKLHRRKQPATVQGAPGSVRALVGIYLESMAERAYTEASIESRSKDLLGFTSWCEARNVVRGADVTKPVVERYQRHLFHHRTAAGRPLGTATQYGRLSSVRVLFRWLVKHNHLLSNPASELELPRVGKRLPRAILSPKEAELVLGQPDVDDVLGLRDRAMLETLYSSGVRRRELVGLSLFDVDTERGTLFIREGKGKKDRLVPIGERALAWVRRYVEEARSQLVVEPDAGTLFLTAAGEALHPDTLTELVRRHVEASGVGKRGACHLFRHTMATAMLEGGADIRFIQAMLGHSDLRTTEVYTRVSIRLLKDIHTATHPAARLGRPRRTRATENDVDPLLPLAADERDE